MKTEKGKTTFLMVKNTSINQSRKTPTYNPRTLCKSQTNIVKSGL